MKTLAITTKHIVNTKNNQFRYSFPQEMDLTGKQIGLASLSMFYSMYNISTAKNNNKVQYIWDGTTYDVTFPDMIAEVQDLQAYLFFHFRSQNHYLNNANGTVLYPLEIFIDVARYSVVIVSNKIPSAYDTTYPQASNTHFTLPSTAFFPKIKMVASNEFHKLIGFSNTYETVVPNIVSGLTITTFSSVSPILNPDANLIVNVNNIIDNKYADPNGVLHSFSVNVSPSSQIVERPNQIAFVDVINGRYKNIDLRILNADTLQDIDIRDPEISILLIIKDRP